MYLWDYTYLEFEFIDKLRAIPVPFFSNPRYNVSNCLLADPSAWFKLIWTVKHVRISLS